MSGSDGQWSKPRKDLPTSSCAAAAAASGHLHTRLGDTRVVHKGCRSGGPQFLASPTCFLCWVKILKQRIPVSIPPYQWLKYCTCLEAGMAAGMLGSFPWDGRKTIIPGSRNRCVRAPEIRKSNTHERGAWAMDGARRFWANPEINWA
ncbi:hypothetical protein ACLOJK_021764 [Asimina triloba]